MPIQRWSDTVWVVRLYDDPDFAEDMEQLTQTLTVDGQEPCLVFDLRSVEYINSSNIAQLLRVHKILKERDLPMAVCEANQRVSEVFETAGLDKVFTIVPDTATALAHVQID